MVSLMKGLGWLDYRSFWIDYRFFCSILSLWNTFSLIEAMLSCAGSKFAMRCLGTSELNIGDEPFGELDGVP